MKRERANEAQGLRWLKVILRQSQSTASNTPVEHMPSNSSLAGKDAQAQEPEVHTVVIAVRQDGRVHDLITALTEHVPGILSNLYVGLYLHNNTSDGIWLQDSEPLTTYRLQDMV